MNRTLKLFASGTLAILSLSAAATAQSNTAKAAETTAAEAKPADARPSRAALDEHFEATRVIKTYYLAHTFQQNDANEILISLRNSLDPRDHVFLVASENAIQISAPPDQQALAQEIIGQLDRAKKAYRLTFTVAESDSGKRIGVQHFSIVVVAGQRTVLKQGSKIPVITASIDKTGEAAQNQYQYLDVGMNFDATLDDLPGGLRLKSKVEQSSVSDEHMSGALASEPIVRQTSLEGTSAVTLGKPITLGSVDIVGTTRHVDIEVVAEPIS